VIPVTIPPAQSSVNFTHISEDLTIPIPSAAVLEDLVLYIGFDPIGAAEEAKRRQPQRPQRSQRRN
jgi:hypothetical protein